MHKDHVARELEVEILTKVRLAVGHFEIWPPTILKSSLLFQCQKHCLYENSEESGKRIYSQTSNVFPYYYNISDD